MAMAFLAQEGWPRLEQVVNVAAMAGMANGAVLGYWLMVVHKWPALLHVALITGLVDAVLLQLLGVVAMDVVAIRTPHLAFQHRVVGRPVEHRTLLLVATEAKFSLVCPGANAIMGSMNLVAVGTPYATVGMGAFRPVHAIVTLVTGKTHFITVGYWGSSLTSEFAEVALDHAFSFD